MSSHQSITLSQAVSAYLGSVAEKQRPEASRELARFVRWFGGERPLAALSPAEIDRYQADLAQTGADPGRLRPLRPFLGYLEKQGLTGYSLAAALRTRRGGGKSETAAPRSAPEPSTASIAPVNEAAGQSPTEASGPAGADLRCSACGETEALRGERRPDAIVVTCQRCGHSWQRDLRPSCRTCGRTNLVMVQQPILEKVRGNQMSVVGTRTVQRCPACDS